MEFFFTIGLLIFAVLAFALGIVMIFDENFHNGKPDKTTGASLMTGGVLIIVFSIGLLMNIYYGDTLVLRQKLADNKIEITSRDDVSKFMRTKQ